MFKKFLRSTANFICTGKMYISEGFSTCGGWCGEVKMGCHAPSINNKLSFSTPSRFSNKGLSLAACKIPSHARICLGKTSDYFYVGSNETM